MRDGTDTEQVGNRLIEVANTPAAVRQMDRNRLLLPTCRLPAALGGGKALVLVTTGGGGKTHGLQRLPWRHSYRAWIDVPGIAGRSPVYIARQIYSFRNNVRKGPMADIMKNVVGKLSDNDVIAVSSYVSSLNPA